MMIQSLASTLGAAGKLLVKKKFTQKLLLAYTANLQTSMAWYSRRSREA